MAAKYKKAKFYLIGKGSLESQLKHIIRQNQMEERIEILSFKKNIQDYFASADVFVNVSRHEGTPNTLLESIALGTRPVVSAIKEHTDILGKDYPFMLTDLSNQDELVELLEKAAETPNINKDLAFAKERIAEMNEKNISQSYLRCFKSVMEHPI